MGSASLLAHTYNTNIHTCIYVCSGAVRVLRHSVMGSASLLAHIMQYAHTYIHTYIHTYMFAVVLSGFLGTASWGLLAYSHT